MGLRLVLALAAVAVAVALRIAWQGYQWEFSDFAPAPLSDALLHPEQSGIQGLREIDFKDGVGRQVAAWYAPSRNRAAVVLAHGTNTDRGILINETRALAQAGFGVLAFDWPGYGHSEGNIDWGPKERSALTAAVDWLGHQADVDPQRIGAYGYSMGAQMLVPTAAADPRIRAVVLGGVPSDMVEQLNWSHRRYGWLSQWPAQWRLYRLWDGHGEIAPKDAVAKIAPRPVFLITSDTDEVVPEWMVRRVYDAAQAPKSLWVLHGARHGHYPESAGAEYGRRLVDFFSRSLLSPRPVANPAEGAGAN